MFIEAILPPPRVFVFGIGYDAVPIVQLVHAIGWDVAVCAHEQRHATRSRFTQADEVLVGTAADLAARVDECDRAVCLVMSHRYELDRDNLGVLAGTRARYIGVLGPRQRTVADAVGPVPRRLRRSAAARARRLDLGAETSHEQALAIIAEIQAVLAPRSGRQPPAGSPRPRRVSADAARDVARRHEGCEARARRPSGITVHAGCTEGGHARLPLDARAARPRDQIHHGPADSMRVTLLGNPTRARYTDYLARVYAFEAPAEWRWMRTPGLDAVIDLAPRLFAPRLAEDLATLGRFPDVCPAHAFKGVAQALGWLYVIERGRLMNSMLHRHLVRRLPFESSIAGSYLGGSGSLGLRWQTLGAVLDQLAVNPSMSTQIVNGALEAFRLMRHPHQPTDAGPEGSLVVLLLQLVVERALADAEQLRGASCGCRRLASSARRIASRSSSASGPHPRRTRPRGAARLVEPEVAGVDRVAVGEDRGALERVGELADVAAPARADSRRCSAAGVSFGTLRLRSARDPAEQRLRDRQQVGCGDRAAAAA